MKILGLLIVVFVLGACTVQAPVRPGDSDYSPVIPATPRLAQPNTGSIFQPNSTLSLFTDTRSSRVGDIITVVLSERTASTKNANTNVSKSSSNDFNDGTLLGTLPSYKNLGLLTDIEQEREFAGTAGSNQNNSLTGSIAVTVSEVLPNGLLAVRGEKWMTLNRGEEFIRIRGIIRPEDIGPDNTIQSTKLADARIAYSGTGELADANQNGWLSRFFNSPLWPF